MADERFVFCAAPDRFLLRHFDGDESVVAFDAASGDTHLLSAFDHSLLILLLQGPATRLELAAELAPRLHADEQPRLDGALAGRLQALRALGLIETAA